MKREVAIDAIVDIVVVVLLLMMMVMMIVVMMIVCAPCRNPPLLGVVFILQRVKRSRIRGVASTGV